MYYSANTYFKERFGGKVYKIALNGGMTCPNRDGKCGTKGCIFCSTGGSGEFTPQNCANIENQIEQAILLVKNKIKTDKYIAYFQSFTNTYAPADYLCDIYMQAVSHPKTVALDIATRPDCLPTNVIQLLSDINKIKPVFVELGLQTIHPKTAQYIRRGYTLEVFDDAVKRLKQAGLNVIVHQIIGLPGETPEMIEETARYIGKSGAHGIKLQLLHILHGTDLEREYLNGSVAVLTMQEYTDILFRCLKVIPGNMVVHRITGDGAKQLLVAPVWSANKKAVLNYINKRLSRENIIQGSDFKL